MRYAAGLARILERPVFGHTRAWLERGRTWLLPPALVLALTYFAHVVGAGAPLSHWYVWRYFAYWALMAAFMLACFVAGHAVLRRLLRGILPLLEHVTLACALGLLIFFLAMFFAGLAKLYGPVLFVALPSAMLLCGGRDAFRFSRRLWRHLRYARRLRERRPSLLSWSLLGLGLIALFLFYLPGIVPGHLGYDSAWYHVPTAEHYASLGGIERFPEGWLMGAIPHLAGLVYCWAFLLPGSDLFDRVALATHLEFATVLMMFPGIPALVRRLVPGVRAHLGWIAFFAFPTVYWHDLLVIADQFAAFWAIPILLAFFRTYPALSLRHGLVLAAVVSGAVLTKYTGVGIAVVPAVALPLRALWLSVSALRRREPLGSLLAPIKSGALICLGVLVLTAPHWAKNWIWYGNPLYPVAKAFFDGLGFESRPWSPDATEYQRSFSNEMANTQPPRNLSGVRETLEALFTHSFAPLDYNEARDRYRGSLFTLFCLCLPFVRASGRLWAAAGIVNAAVLAWYWQTHQDRYLMAIVPAMAAVVVAVASLAWRSSLPARLGVFALVGFHTLWSLGVFALSNPVSHYRAVIDLAVAAAARKKDAGLGQLAPWKALEKRLPPDAKVLIHAMHGHTGLGRPSVNDWPLNQLGLSYGRMKSPAEVYRALSGMGVTHLVWADGNWLEDSVTSDLRFFEFVQLYAKDPQTVAGLHFARMPARAPASRRQAEFVAVFGCDSRIRPGRYRFEALALANPIRRPQAKYPGPEQAFTGDTDAAAELARAAFVMSDAKCGLALPEDWKKSFLRIASRPPFELFARKP